MSELLDSALGMLKRISFLEAENESLRAALSEARKDAERLDWLQKHCSYSAPPGSVAIEFDDYEDDIRALINGPGDDWPQIRTILDLARGAALRGPSETENG